MATRAFDLIETMRFEALDGFVELERHLSRMKASAEALGFAFNRHDCRNDLQAATFRLTEDSRVRLMLARSGALAIEIRAMPARPSGPVEVALRPLPIAADDLRLRHKTTDRLFLDEARQAAGTFEVLRVVRVTVDDCVVVFEATTVTSPSGSLSARTVPLIRPSPLRRDCQPPVRSSQSRSSARGLPPCPSGWPAVSILIPS